jgi:hypothetical protein
MAVSHVVPVPSFALMAAIFAVAGLAAYFAIADGKSSKRPEATPRSIGRALGFAIAIAILETAMYYGAFTAMRDLPQQMLYVTYGFAAIPGTQLVMRFAARLSSTTLRPWARSLGWMPLTFTAIAIAWLLTQAGIDTYLPIRFT